MLFDLSLTGELLINASSITDHEFALFQRLIHEHAGIALGHEKKIMVASRLARRLHFYGFASYMQYYRFIQAPDHAQEFQVMVDMLTTNETYFFREPKHFEFLRNTVLKAWRGDAFKIWSAASSSGEEVYSLAIVLAETLGERKWEVIGSDISTRMLETARHAVYPMDRLEFMDDKLLEKYCLRGVRSQQGYFCVGDKLKRRTRFEQINLTKPLPSSWARQFEVVFLRNVLIYFDLDVKKAVVDNICETLKPGGYLFISHSENLHHISTQLSMVKPSIYIKG